MNELGISLVWLVAQVTLLCAATAVIYFVARRRHPAAGATAALSGVLLTVVLTLGVFSPWPRWSLDVDSAATTDASATPSDHRSPDTATPTSRDSEPVATDSDAGVDPPRDAALESTSSAAWSAFWRSLERELSAPPPPPVDAGFRWPAWLAVSLVLAMAVGALRLLAGWLTVRRCLRRSSLIDDRALHETLDVLRAELGCRRDVELRESGDVASAATVGWRKPIVLLPRSWRDWSDAERRAVLAHELAHVTAGDAASWLAAQFGLLLHFYHPLVHWLAQRLRLEHELAADALAARLTGSSNTYLTTLAELAVRQPDRPLAWPARAFLPTRGTLLRRIEMLRDTKTQPQRSSTLRRATVITLTLAAALLAAGLRPRQSHQVFSQDSTSTTPKEAHPSPQSPRTHTHNVNVYCVNTRGEPVAGAEVHLYQYTGGDDGHYRHFGPFTSDAEGRAVVAEAIFSDELGHFDRWIYARVPGRLVGFARCAKWKNRRHINPEGRVELQSCRSVEGQVTVPEGFDPTTVTVQVRTMWVYTGSGDFDIQIFSREQQFPGLDTSLPQIFESQPDANGHVRFYDVPVPGRLTLVTRGDGLGEAQWWNKNRTFDEPIQLTIEKESSLFGRVLLPNGDPAAGMEVACRISEHQAYLSTFKTVTDENGEFVLRGLPQTKFVLSVKDPKGRLTFRPLENIVVERDGALPMTLQMETAVLVTGRVFDPSGEPVEGAAISAISPSGNGPGLDHDMTDLAGRYRLRVPAGSVRLYFNSLPDGFAYPEPQIVKQLDISPGQADIENLDFTIPRDHDEAARQTQTKNNLKQIGLAFHNYHDVRFGDKPPHFPPAVVYGRSENGRSKHPHSWRVAILPFIEHAELYQQYNVDEPWDSENNLKVLRQMPDVFRSPNDDPGSTNTAYFVITGEHTAAGNTPGEGIGIRDFTDGTANTLLVVEAKRDIPWTKPEDITYVHDKELPDLGEWLGGWHEGGFYACFADGAVRFISDAVDKSVFRFLITRDDGQDHRRVFQILGLE